MNMHDLLGMLAKSLMVDEMETVRKLFQDLYPFYYRNSSDPIPHEFKSGMLMRLDDLCRERGYTYDETAVANALMN